MTESADTPLPTPEEQFSAASVIRTMADAPKDGSIFVARDGAGDVAFIRWRTHPEIEDEIDDPYWARLNTDEMFAPVAWVPTTWTIDEIWDAYID